MHELAFLRDTVILLAAAVVFVFAFQRMRASPVLGYLVGGVLIGPHALGLIDEIEATRSLAELGVVFLMFSIGLELSFKRLSTLRGGIFGLGTAQVLLTGLIIGAAAWLIGVGVTASIVIGSGIALSSTAVVLQLLAERGELASRVGRTSFSILLLQDVAVVPLIAMVPLLAAEQVTDLEAVGLGIVTAVAALAAIVVAGRLILRPVFRAIAGLRGSEVFVAITLLAVLGTGWAAEQAGLSLTLGAFLAGLLLAETEFRHQIEVDIRPFQGLLLGLFFITIGMSIDIGLAAERWWLVGLLLVGLITVKAAVIIGLCAAIRVPIPAALHTGLMLAQGGEFAFILVGAAVDENILEREVAQLCLVVVSLSLAATPILAALGKWLAGKLERQLPIGLAALEQEFIDLRDHVVIAGFGRFGQVVASVLESHRIPYVALDMDATRVSAWRNKGKPIHFGDAYRPELLWGTGVDRAAAMIITLDGAPAEVLRMVRTLHERLPGLKLLVRARDSEHARQLLEAGATMAVPDALASSLHLAQSVLRSFELPEKDLSELIREYETRS